VLGFTDLLQAGIEGPDQEFLFYPLENVRVTMTEALAAGDTLFSPSTSENEVREAKQVLDDALGRVGRELSELNERVSRDGLDAVLVDLLRIDFAARHAAALVNHPLVAARLAGNDAGLSSAPADKAWAQQGAAIAWRRAGLEEVDHETTGTVLVVDDDGANREVLSRRLRRLGHTVVTAGNGREAIEILRAKPIDVVLLDLLMPEMNGYEVLERCKDDPDLRHIPLIMISADDELDRAVDCIEMGAEDYLSKPFDPVLLEARVGASLEKKRLLDQEKALLATVQQQALELAELNETLEARVHRQVEEIARLAQLRRFLSPQLADLIVAQSGGALETHRREIAVLFCDLRGFTAFAETAEPEEVMLVLGEFHRSVGALIHEFEATVGFFAGDGLMVFFNDPVPCPDPAEKAVRLAVAMRDRIAELMPNWRARGYNLGFGVGVSFGYATLGQMGFEGRLDYGVIGSVVNLAARLCDHAQSGQILISGRTALAVDNVWELEDVGDLTLKGFHSNVRAFRVVSRK
jgi:adenylate cyclase